MRSLLLPAAAVLVGVLAPLSAAQVAVTPAREFPQIGQARAGAPVAEGTGAIVGRVVDTGSGQPLEGVRVQLSGTGRGQSAISDDDGRFAFAALRAGEYTLRGSKTGYVSVTYGQKVPAVGRAGTPIDLAEGQEIKDLTFAIPRGGVITGIVFDEKNRPSVGTPVRVMRWSMSSGERTLSQSNSTSTDDRGIYRVYGLPPGDYVVSAVPRNQLISMTAEAEALIAEAMRERELALGGLTVVTPDLPVVHDVTHEDEPLSGYAPVYYPGTTQPSGASTIRLGISEERAGVDFGLSKVTLARVTGTVIVPQDGNTSSITIRLVEIDESVPGLNRPSTRAGRDGRFTFNGVPPGRYRAVAIATTRNRVTVENIEGGVRQVTESERLWAMTDLVVGGGNVPDLILTLQQGMTVSGRVMYLGNAPMPAPNARVRLSLGPFGSLASAMGAGSSSVNVGPDGRFTFTGLVPGPYRIRSVSGASGWSLGSAMIAGRDTLDFALVVEPGQNLQGLDVALVDKTSSLNGSIQSALGGPIADYTVILFPADSRYWGPQARRIRATRPSTTGKFSYAGLPPGEYRLAAVTDAEAGQWYDPAFLQQLMPASVAVTLLDGQARTQDIRVAGQ